MTCFVANLVTFSVNGTEWYCHKRKLGAQIPILLHKSYWCLVLQVTIMSYRSWGPRLKTDGVGKGLYNFSFSLRSEEHVFCQLSCLFSMGSVITARKFKIDCALCESERR